MVRWLRRRIRLSTWPRPASKAPVLLGFRSRARACRPGPAMVDEVPDQRHGSAGRARRQSGRFAPPLWKSRPVAVTCRIEVRFHSGRDQNRPRGCRGVNRPSIPSAVRSVRRSRPESAIRDNPELRAAASRGCERPDSLSHQTVRGNGGIRSEAETAVRYGHDLSSWAASCRVFGEPAAGSSNAHPSRLSVGACEATCRRGRTGRRRLSGR